MSKMRRLFIGRLDKSTRTSDIEDLFEVYGKLARCEVKYGTDHAYAFVDYEDDRDAEDAIKGENGRKLNGASMIVEWSRGRNTMRGGGGGRGYGGRGMGGPRGGGPSECYSCGRRGHFSRDCPESGYKGGFRRSGGGGGRRYERSYSRSRSRSPRNDRHQSRSRSRSARRSRSRSARRSRSGSPPARIVENQQRSRSARRSRSGSRSGSPPARVVENQQRSRSRS